MGRRSIRITFDPSVAVDEAARSCEVRDGVRIYLVRHGDADAEIPEGLGDEARALTTKARHQVRGHFEALSDQQKRYAHHISR